MTHDEITAKFMDNTGTVMSKARAQALHDLILNIEACPSARDFANLLRG
jgi:hypothetical protein